jgi:hypothetical protein
MCNRSICTPTHQCADCLQLAGYVTKWLAESEMPLPTERTIVIQTGLSSFVEA